MALVGLTVAFVAPSESLRPIASVAALTDEALAGGGPGGGEKWLQQPVQSQPSVALISQATNDQRAPHVVAAHALAHSAGGGWAGTGASRRPPGYIGPSRIRTAPARPRASCTWSAAFTLAARSVALSAAHEWEALSDDEIRQVDALFADY